MPLVPLILDVGRSLEGFGARDCPGVVFRAEVEDVVGVGAGVGDVDAEAEAEALLLARTKCPLCSGCVVARSWAARVGCGGGGGWVGLW